MLLIIAHFSPEEMAPSVPHILPRSTQVKHTRGVSNIQEPATPYRCSKLEFSSLRTRNTNINYRSKLCWN